ncbi:piggyBac transposable element-derived protein 3-like [Ornithodoros turicata]|uniref:piggyBac transposable element-derived protein 3-like n=1 Tax=Ornithodoros turicata TaxID=34597 RepID=UPI00313A401A
MKHFVGATLMMSCLGYPNIRMYWADATRLSAIADVITRDRFFTLRSNLKAVNDLDVPDEEKKTDRLRKVRPLLNQGKKACRELPRTAAVSIDEQIIPFTGATTFKQYVPGKPHPNRLKNFVLASPAGLVLDFEIYLLKACLQGGGNPSLGCFTTVPLLESLAEKDLRGTGTIMKNRLPKDAKLEDDKSLTKKRRGASCQVVNASSGVCIVEWVGNKPITLASTRIEYNKNMGGVDLCDRMLNLYPTTKRTKRWTVRTMLFSIDLAAVNSWLQYKEDCINLHKAKKDILGLLEFKMALAHLLL